MGFTGYLSTFGDWTSFHRGCGHYWKIGDKITLYTGGSNAQPGAFISANYGCSVYDDKDHSISARINDNTVRVFWI